MRRIFIVMIMITLPFFANAQEPNFIKEAARNIGQRHAENILYPMQKQYPELPKTPLFKPLSRNHIENAEAKLVAEERKLKKLENEAQEKKDDLKTKQEKLLNLEKDLKDANDFDWQKNIIRTKEQITKTQNKLNKIKTLIESKLKKVADLEIAMEDAKFKREEDY